MSQSQATTTAAAPTTTTTVDHRLLVFCLVLGRQIFGKTLTVLFATFRFVCQSVRPSVCPSRLRCPRCPCDLCATLARRSLLNYVKFFGSFATPPPPSSTLRHARRSYLSCLFRFAVCSVFVRQVRVLSLSFCALLPTLVALPGCQVVFSVMFSCVLATTGCKWKLKNLLA